MSLLSNLREWIGLEEAMKIAIAKGLFPGVSCLPSFSDMQYKDIRRDIFLAYTEGCLGLRLSTDNPVFIFCPEDKKSFPVQVWLGAKEADGGWSCSGGTVFRTIESAHSIQYDDAKRWQDFVWIDDPWDIAFNEGDKLRKTPAYVINEKSEFQCLNAITWEEIAYSPLFVYRNCLELHRPSLDVMLNKATGKAIQGMRDILSPPPATVHLPYMNKTLAAVIKVMESEWGDGKSGHTPKQVNVARAIDEALGNPVSSDKQPSRMASSLATAIQPDEIKAADKRRNVKAG